MSTKEVNPENENLNTEEKANSTENAGQSETQGVYNAKVELTFINESNDMNNSEVVIFQKNVATDFEELAVAWRVIKNCGRGWKHPFTYSNDVQIAAADAYGNHTTKLTADEGQKWKMSMSSSGDLLELSGPSASPVEIELQNNLQQGSIDANIYRDGKLLASKTGIPPMQKAVFQFRPTIYIGVVSQINEGDIMNSAVLSDINTEISLLGLSKADIIMTGGGVGPSAKPFQFHLVPKA